MPWTEDIAANVLMLDNRHSELLRRLDSLRAAIREQVCRYTIADMLKFLERYAVARFSEEESYMKYYGYPDYELHREKHENFATELHFLMEELRSIRESGLNGSYELSVETVQVVVDWLCEHVMVYDRALGDFLRRYGFFFVM